MRLESDAFSPKNLILRQAARAKAKAKAETQEVHAIKIKSAQQMANNNIYCTKHRTER